MSVVDQVLNNRDLFGLIMSFKPLSEIEKINRRKVISHLKHFHCEWSYHVRRCCICYWYHPCIINKCGRPRHICNECNNSLRARLYYFFNY